MKQTLQNRIIDIYANNARVAILMSGKGSNADVILSQAHRYPSLSFITICTDNQRSNAKDLSQKYNLKYFCQDTNSAAFNREGYFQTLAEYLKNMQIDTLIYAGFMKIAPPFFVNQFPGINVHPSDLTILGEDGKPKYTGMHAVKDAVTANENYIASTAYVVNAEVDCGPPLLVSKHLALEGRLIHDIHLLHEQLKIGCEHLLFPRILELLSKGLINPKHTPYHWDKIHDSMKIKDGQFFVKKLFNSKNILSPLDLAYISQDYSSEVGFDFDHIDQVMNKVIEEINELKAAYANRENNFNHFVDEIGDCFFSLVNLCRFINLHPEAIVSRNVTKYLNRCQHIETELKLTQRHWSDLTSSEIIPMWKKAKTHENIP